MERRALPELHCKQMEGAAQLVGLAIDDALAVQQLLAEFAVHLARECNADAAAAAPAPTAAIAARRARYLRRVAPLMVATAQKLADAGATTRTRFSRLLTERLAAGSHDGLDNYQAFFKVLPGQSADATDLLSHALDCGEQALERMAAAAAAIPAADDYTGSPRAPACA